MLGLKMSQGKSLGMWDGLYELIETLNTSRLHSTVPSRMYFLYQGFAKTHSIQAKTPHTYT